MHTGVYKRVYVYIDCNLPSNGSIPEWAGHPTGSYPHKSESLPFNERWYNRLGW